MGAQTRIRQSGLCSRPADSAAAVAGAKPSVGREGPSAGSWLTKELDGCLAQGFLWALQVRQALVQVLLRSAAVLRQLVRARGDRVGAEPPLRPRLASPTFPCPDTHDVQPAAGRCWALEGAEDRVLPRVLRCHPAAKAQRGTPGCRGGKGSPCALQASGAGAQLPAPHAGHRGRGASPGCLWGFGAVLTRRSATLQVCSVSSSFRSRLRFRSLAAPRRASREACRAPETGRWHRRPGARTWRSLGRARAGGWQGLGVRTLALDTCSTLGSPRGLRGIGLCGCALLPSSAASGRAGVGRAPPRLLSCCQLCGRRRGGALSPPRGLRRLGPN